MKCIKWLSTFLLIGGGIMIAINISESKWGFILFLLGHITLIYIFVKEQETALWTQSIGFLLIDLLSIYYWFELEIYL
jgi:uncharacterized membrane protein YhhN